LNENICKYDYVNCF